MIASFLSNVFVSFCIILLTNQKLGFAHTAYQLLFFLPHIKKEIGGAQDKDYTLSKENVDFSGTVCSIQKVYILLTQSVNVSSIIMHSLEPHLHIQIQHNAITLA